MHDRKGILAVTAVIALFTFVIGARLAVEDIYPELGWVMVVISVPVLILILRSHRNTQGEDRS